MSLESDVNSCIQLLDEARNELAREPASGDALRMLEGIKEKARTLLVRLQVEEKKARYHHSEYIKGAGQLGFIAAQSDMKNGGAHAIHYAGEVARLAQRLRLAVQESSQEATPELESTLDAPTKDNLEGRISRSDSPHLDTLQPKWLGSSWLEEQTEEGEKLLGHYTVMKEVDESEKKEREMYYYLCARQNRPRRIPYS